MTVDVVSNQSQSGLLCHQIGVVEGISGGVCRRHDLAPRFWRMGMACVNGVRHTPESIWDEFQARAPVPARPRRVLSECQLPAV